MSAGIDETIDVFGEAFMKLLRDRLELQMLTTCGSSPDSYVVVEAMLVDKKAPEGQQLISQARLRLELNIPTYSGKPHIEGITLRGY